MLTTRGWWFLLMTFTCLGVGILTSPTSVSILNLFGVSALVWFLGQWLRFAIEAHTALASVRITRRLLDDRSPVNTLWMNQPFTVEVSVLCEQGDLVYAVIEDRLPFGIEPVPGSATQCYLRQGVPLTLRYQLRIGWIGSVRFEGVRIIASDVQGLFCRERFVRDPQVVLVLAPLVDADAQPRTAKRLNILPPPGIHRMRRAGSGSELLDLREYRPGDPPKMIAWKASAKRDLLISKEFESELPVRCTLLVDAYPRLRIGSPGHTPLGQLIELSATVAQAAIANRDLVGLVLINESETTVLRPARDRSHLITLLRRLAQANSHRVPPTPEQCPELIDRCYLLIREVYPEALLRENNQLPLRLHWRPLLDAPLQRQLLLGLLTILLALIVGFQTGAQLSAQPAVALLITLVSLGPIGSMLWLVYGLSGWLTARQRSQRKQVAAVLAQRLQLGVGAIGRLIEDDQALAQAAGQFLDQHHIPYSIRLTDTQGRPRFDTAKRIERFAHALVRGVGLARDNELFIILADLLEADEYLAPLLQAIRTARARHHQVLVVCPWPAGLPDPDDQIDDWLRQHRPQASQLEAEVFRCTISNYHAAYHRVRHALGRFGTSLIRANQHDTIKTIFDRLTRLRLAESR